jgi:DNA-directed RNA polymerase subunit E'/Rpb7
MSSQSSVLDNSIYTKQILSTTLFLKPKDLSKNINKVLQQILSKKVEGVCLKEGYVRPGSTKILSRTEGRMNLAIFDGNTNYIIKYEAEVCNPQRGQIITCEVIDNNKSSVNAFVEDIDSSPLNIFLARQHHIGNSEFASLQKGDQIKIKVIEKGFEYLHKYILVIGEYIGKD